MVGRELTFNGSRQGLCKNKRRHKGLGVEKDARCWKVLVNDWKSGRFEHAEVDSRAQNHRYLFFETEGFGPQQQPHLAPELFPPSDD
jgi:hypothetical protein